MAELKEKLMSQKELKEKWQSQQEAQPFMSQKVALQVDSPQYDTFVDGEKLLGDDLRELGLEEDTNHMKIEFDNDKSAKYCFCKAFLIFLSTVYGLPVFLLTFPCIWYNTKVWAKSRLAAVTDNKLVLKQGYYGCCCCCWNEKTKSVPLDKITDLRLEQGCIQKCYDIQGIVVETASSVQEKPEMALIGLYKPRAARSMILKVRDAHGLAVLDGTATTKGAANATNNSYNPLLPSNQAAQQMDTKELEDLITQQHQTMIQIKDVLQDMKTALVSMDQKMAANDDGDDVTPDME